MISARCVVRDLHTTAPGPLERICWIWFAAQWGDCKKSQTAPLSAIISSSSIFPPVRNVGITIVVTFVLIWPAATLQVVTFRLHVIVQVEEGCGKNTGEWASKKERQWKLRTGVGRKAREGMDRKEEPRVMPLGFQGRRWTFVTRRWLWYPDNLHGMTSLSVFRGRPICHYSEEDQSVTIQRMTNLSLFRGWPICHYSEDDQSVTIQRMTYLSLFRGWPIGHYSQRMTNLSLFRGWPIGHYSQRMTNLSLFTEDDQSVTVHRGWPIFHYLQKMTDRSLFTEDDQSFTIYKRWPIGHYSQRMTNFSVFTEDDQSFTIQRMTNLSLFRGWQIFHCSEDDQSFAIHIGWPIFQYVLTWLHTNLPHSFHVCTTYGFEYRWNPHTPPTAPLLLSGAGLVVSPPPQELKTGNCSQAEPHRWHGYWNSSGFSARCLAL